MVVELATFLISGGKRNPRASSVIGSKGDIFLQGNGVPKVPKYLPPKLQRRTEQS